MSAPKKQLKKTEASNHSTVAERVRRTVAAHQGVAEDEITDDTPLFRDLASFDIEELIKAFENEFSCSIPNADAAVFHTVGDVIRYLEKECKQATESSREISRIRPIGPILSGTT